MDTRSHSSELALFSLGVVAGPELEFIGEEFAGEVGEAGGEARLRVGDGLVVDGGGYLLKKVVEQQASLEFSYGLGELVGKVALERGDGGGAGGFGEFDGLHGKYECSKSEWGPPH